MNPLLKGLILFFVIYFACLGLWKLIKKFGIDKAVVEDMKREDEKH
jgi:hypothetical protein